MKLWTLISFSAYLSYVAAECGSEEIACADGSECIHERYFCDGKEHCKDGSDESELPTGGVDGIMCDNIHSKREKKCFLREENCCRRKSNSICLGGIDRCFCSQEKSRSFLSGLIFKRCFRCFTAPHYVIPIQNICDSIINCADLTDEALCGWNAQIPIIHSVKINDTSELSPRFTCSDVNSSSEEIDITIDQICDNIIDCYDKIDEKNCGVHVVANYTCQFERKEASACDGVPQCTKDLYQEECQCNDNPSFCRYVNSSSTGNESYFICPSTGDRINGNRVCDAIYDCPHHEDEVDCPKRFYCTNSSFIHVSEERKCDAVKDCDDGSDEGRTTCGSELFYCDDGGFEDELGWNKVCDGIQSCASGVDECQPQCIDSVFSDVKSLVRNKGILSLIWIICIMAVLGNMAVACKNIWKICLSDKSDHRAKINRALITSLSLSDLLVGIHATGVCVSSITFEGQYCLKDSDWRSGSVCQCIGILLTIGSEQSVFNMVLITISRIEITWRPFSRPRKSLYLALIFLTWTVSIILAILPILDFNQDFFLREVWYGEGQHYSFQITRSQLDYQIKWLLLSQNALTESDKTTGGKWLLLSKLLRNVMPDATPTRSFGYYSRHTVCLPNLFGDNNDTSWSYSLILVLINLLAFIFMFIGYVIIYKKATANNIARPPSLQKKTSGKMQAKLTRILMTDFCCWVPICIMCLLQISGVRINNDAYLPAGLIIIPINSALNPFLYTDIPEILWKKLEKTVQQIRGSIRRINCLSSNEDHHNNTRQGNRNIEELEV